MEAASFMTEVEGAGALDSRVSSGQEVIVGVLYISSSKLKFFNRAVTP